MLGGLRERMEEALRDAEEEVEDELEVLEETLRELENDGEFDIIIEEAFPLVIYNSSATSVIIVNPCL